MQATEYRNAPTKNELWQSFSDQGMEFQLGVLSVNVMENRFDLITPEGERLRLNPRMNRQALIHLHQQPVRVLLRASPWPLVRPSSAGSSRHVSKVAFDVLFVERLSEPPELENVEVEELSPSFNWEEESDHDGAFAS